MMRLASLFSAIFFIACGNGGTPIDMLPQQDMLAPSDLSPPSQTCDPFQQDCSDPAEKCSLVLGDGGFVPSCIPSGDRMLNDTCTSMPGLAGEGHDDCAKGLACASIGLAQNERQCRQWCESQTDCASTERCSLADATVGLCVPSCAPFAACSAGLTCGFLGFNLDNSYGLSCRSIGTTATGLACMSSLDCSADAVCSGSGTSKKCVSLCDGGHSCAAGSCLHLTGFPSGSGICP
jgi:hypothetical protein